MCHSTAEGSRAGSVLWTTGEGVCTCVHMCLCVYMRVQVCTCVHVCARVCRITVQNIKHWVLAQPQSLPAAQRLDFALMISCRTGLFGPSIFPEATWPNCHLPGLWFSPLRPLQTLQCSTYSNCKPVYGASWPPGQSQASCGAHTWPP